MVSANQNEGFAHKGLSLGTSPKYPTLTKRFVWAFSITAESHRRIQPSCWTADPLSAFAGERRSKGWKKKELDLRASKQGPPGTRSAGDMATERDVQNVKMERRNCEPMLRDHVWPALGKRRTPGDILYWPRDDQVVPFTNVVVPFTHWAVYIGRRKLAPHGQSWMVDRCEVTGAELPEAVVHLWGAADSSTRDISRDAVVVYNRVDEVGGTPYDGNLGYDARHTPMKPAHILDRCLRALSHKVYEARFGGYDVLGNNCEHFATWARYGWNQSAQVSRATTYGAMGLGALIGGGLPGAFVGLALQGLASKEIGSLRRAQSNNFKDHPEDTDEEVDWVVDSLLRNTEDHFRLLDEEARAYAKRREHLPRGATLTPDEEEAEERKRTLLHFDSRSARLNVAGWDIFGGERAAPSEGDGPRRDDVDAAEPAPRETDPERPRQRDPVEELKGIATGVGSLAVSLLGGMLKVGGALASEIASQHNAHQEKLRLLREREEAERRERGEIAPPAGVVIEEIAD